MAYQSEAELELQFIDQLNKQGYNTVSIPDYDALVENFKVQFEAFNASKLDKPFTDKEWERILNLMLGKSVFQSAKILRDKFVLEREDGSKVYLSFFDSDHTKNIFQVTHQTIRLTYLIPELLSMVDDGKIAFNPAVEISYLEQSEQRVLLNAMELNDCTPSHAQSIRLKKLSQEGVLQDRTIYDILAEQKPNQQEQYKFKREDVRKYFPKSYTDKQVCDTVIKLLEQWQRRRERDRDSR